MPRSMSEFLNFFSLFQRNPVGSGILFLDVIGSEVRDKVMDWFARAVSIITAFAAVVAIVSKWADARSQRAKSQQISDWCHWARSDDGKFFMRSYIEDLEDE